SDSTPRPEKRWKALLWPEIRNDGDFDYVTEQGFWVCFVDAAFTLVIGLFTGSPGSAFFEFSFFFLAGIGVRQRVSVAGVSAVRAFLLSGFVLQRYTGNGFGLVRIIFLALLFANLRGIWLSSRWQKSLDSEPPIRLKQTIFDKLSDQMPPAIWPKGRW